MASSDRTAEARTYSSIISAVRKAGLRTFNEGQKLDFEVEQQPNGRAAAINLAETG